jgi:hypothetical protein
MIDAFRGGSGERRQARSSDPLVALSRLLDAARRVGRLEALAVADETGLLVAGAGLCQTCEHLASIAPLLAENDSVPTRIDVLARRSEVRRLSVDGIQVLLCGQGDESDRDRGLKHAAEGCERILGRSRHRGRTGDR